MPHCVRATSNAKTSEQWCGIYWSRKVISQDLREAQQGSSKGEACGVPEPRAEGRHTIADVLAYRAWAIATWAAFYVADLFATSFGLRIKGLSSVTTGPRNNCASLVAILIVAAGMEAPYHLQPVAADGKSQLVKWDIGTPLEQSAHGDKLVRPQQTPTSHLEV